MYRQSVIEFNKSILNSIREVSFHEPALSSMVMYYLSGNILEKYSSKVIYLQLYKFVYERMCFMYKQLGYIDNEASKISDANLDGQPVYKYFKSGLMDKTILSVIRNKNMFGVHEQLSDEDMTKGIYVLLWSYSNHFKFFEEYHEFEANKFKKKKSGYEFFNN
jgi:hypothetical protein